MLKFALIRQYLYILKRKNGKRIQKGLYNTLVFASFLELFFCIIFLPGSKFDKSKDNFLLLHYVKKNTTKKRTNGKYIITICESNDLQVRRSSQFCLLSHNPRGVE